MELFGMEFKDSDDDQLWHFISSSIIYVPLFFQNIEFKTWRWLVIFLSLSPQYALFTSTGIWCVDEGYSWWHTPCFLNRMLSFFILQIWKFSFCLSCGHCPWKLTYSWCHNIEKSLCLRNAVSHLKFLYLNTDNMMKMYGIFFSEAVYGIVEVLIQIENAKRKVNCLMDGNWKCWENNKIFYFSSSPKFFIWGKSIVFGIVAPVITLKRIGGLRDLILVSLCYGFLLFFSTLAVYYNLLVAAPFGWHIDQICGFINSVMCTIEYY